MTSRPTPATLQGAVTTITSMKATVALIAVLLVATGCSGSETGLTTTTGVTTTPTDPVDTTAPSSTAGSDPPTTPSTPPTSATTTPTTSAPTTPPTTSPTTSATSEALDLRAQIEADLNEGELAYLAAAADPASPDSQAVLAKYFAGSSLDVVRDIFRQLVDEGLAVKPNPAVPNIIRVLSQPQPVDGSATKMTIDLCRIDAAIVYTPPTTPGGPELIFNDRIVKETSRSIVELRDDIWIFSGGTELAPDEPGVTTCD